MSGNTFGRAFCVTTFGESHGPGVGTVIDGCPPGIVVDVGDFQAALERRATARTRFTSQRKEPDEVEILSGVFEGRTLGTPIGLLVRNRDAKSKDYSALQHVFRPGHGDFTYQRKYGLRDWRGGGRASARETVARVLAGTVARAILSERGITVQGWLEAVGELTFSCTDPALAETNPYFCPEPGKVDSLEQLLTKVWKSGDSVGACIAVEARGVPAGWGDPVFDRLDATIAQAMMSIPAVKAVSIGDGFSVVTQRGHEARDAMSPSGFTSNHAGGVLAGISTGQPVVVRLAFKPTSSIPQVIDSIDEQGHPAPVRVTGRHDPCVGLRAAPIAEAMLAIVLADHMLRNRGQNSR